MQNILKMRLKFLEKRCFYIWLLPLLWCFFAVMSFFHSGDEHGCFAYGALAGWWISLIHQFDSLKAALLPILIAGAVIIALFGFLMDWLKVGKMMFFVLAFIFAALIFGMNVSPFESLEQVQWKHGSVFAIVFLTCNQSIYVAIIVSIIGSLIKRTWQILTRQSHS